MAAFFRIVLVLALLGIPEKVQDDDNQDKSCIVHDE